MGTVAKLTLFLPIAWLAPERLWPPLSEAISSVTGRLFSQKRRADEARIPPFLAGLLHLDRTRAVTKCVATENQQIFAILRAYRPGGWRPEISLLGRDNLEAALEAGKGVILWVADLSFAYLVVKMALARSGYSLTHLSRPQHGFSDSPFGIRFLNPIQTNVEKRYLAERIVIRPGDTLGNLRELRRRLTEGGIISTTVGEIAAQTRAVPFFDGQMLVATGPITLARATGAAVLPVFTLQRGPGRFEVSIEPPLEGVLQRGDERPFREYARLLEKNVRSDPAGWWGWRHNKFRPLEGS